MKKHLVGLLVLFVFLGASNEDKSLQRLRKLEQEIRSRASEADAEVAKTQAESDAITTKAAADAQRIRDEANEYVRKIQSEIKEMEKGQGKKIPGAPDREILQATLQSLTDPLLSCWAKPKRKDLEECLLSKTQTALAVHLPGPPKICKPRCD